MSDKIAEIRARQEEARTRLAYDAVSWQCERDRAFLLAEDERHRAENERLCKAMTNMMIVWRHIRSEREEYRAEVERQRAEIERLQDQNGLFRRALAFVAAYRSLHNDPQKNPSAWHMSSVAQEALEGKP